MNKYLLALIATFLLACTSSCATTKSSIINYGIDENGNLIAYYDNGTSRIVDDFANVIVDNIHSVDINDDGYFVINNIDTTINCNLLSQIVDIELSDDGFFIVNGKNLILK